MVHITGPLSRPYSGPMSVATGGRPAAAGADFLQLTPAAAPARGLTAWLADALRAAIMDGRLAAGAALPATRALAGDLGVSRGVIVEAYQRLTDEGLVAAHHGAGTRVLPRPDAAPPGPPLSTAPPSTAPPSAAPPSSPARVQALPAGRAQLPQPWRTQAELDLSPGVPDLSGFPRAAWLRAERAVLAQAVPADLGYGDPAGSAWLRQELAGWLARTRGLRAGAGDIIIVAGVSQGLALLAQVLCGQRPRGRPEAAVEDPGSRGARDQLAYWGMDPVPVPVDEHGLRVTGLERTAAVAALLTPAHQFPTGAVLAPQRRRDLLHWATTAGALVIEDDYDAEYRYDRAPVPALQASAPDQVAYLGSTSKTLIPGLRLGWLVPPAGLQAPLLAAKHASDLGNPALPQLVLAQLISTGELARHIRTARARQRERRDALLAALREHLPQARVQGVAAGLHLLITFPDQPHRPAHPRQPSDADLARRIQQAGVMVHPLSLHQLNPGPPGLVLGYAAHPPGQLREAARRIGTAAAAWLMR
jgi:GntR family transcriptional regulator/MocR family aminotransferase